MPAVLNVVVKNWPGEVRFLKGGSLPKGSLLYGHLIWASGFMYALGFGFGSLLVRNLRFVIARVGGRIGGKMFRDGVGILGAFLNSKPVLRVKMV